MPKSIRPSGSRARGDKRLVVLLLPEVLGDAVDPAQLRATLASASTTVRVLLCLLPDDDRALVDVLTGLGVETEILLGADVPMPQTTAFVLRAPPGISPGEQKDFALALSDVVLVGPASGQSSFVRTATERGKPLIVPGGPLPRLPPLVSVTHRLDPEAPGWHARGRSCFGRFEQAIMEMFAYNWLGRHQGGVAESRKRLRNCFGREWQPSAYFAPDGCLKEAPDPAAIDPSSRIAAQFDAMDRSALYGSYVHRDLIWTAHLAAAFAVFAAVAGHLSVDVKALASTWGVLELLSLLLVMSLVLGARRSSLQDRWTACRFGAEQLRIARMSLPLLVLPPALATEDAMPVGNDRGSKEIELGLLALAEVKRAVRDQGLPRLEAALTPVRAAAWLHCIVADQAKYHHRNHHKLEQAESRLRFTTQAIFVLTMIAVVAHFCSHAEGLLFVTAAGPALAAALHGAGIRLGIVHRAALSLGVERDLRQIAEALDNLIKHPPSPEDAPAVKEAWREVRRLASKAAETMGQENASWHGLVRRYQDELP
ncbi:MAG TPA: hypothetical protein VF601_21475 [Beijerinckiaceae bacterium]